MTKQSTATIVLHDAHVAARAAAGAAAGAAFMAAYQSICCFIAAVAITCVARRAVRADRVATKAANRAATKAANAARVARKEAAEQYASRCAKRAAAKKAAAPAARAAKKAAAAAAKAIKALNECRIMAVRAQRMAAKATATIEAATTRATAAATRSAADVRATRAATTADKRAAKAAVVAFLAQTPCLAALWFYATLNVADKAANKEAAKIANRAYARVKAPRVPMNDAEKRAAITLACANARAANAAKRAAEAAKRAADARDIARFGSVMNPATIAARKEQGAAQRAANAARKAGMPTKTPRPHVVIVRSGPVKNKGAKRTKVHHMVHTVESVMAQVAKKAATVKAKEDAAITKAKKWAMRKAAYANRKAAMEQIASDAWMLKGVWLPEDLIRGANDWSYTVRINAFKKARNIAYGTVALVGAAA
ncbi:hypothetical protein [uncultured Flavobacterium sp.]|uniref:hypothetical protein n=1 Tax=uncultured Flavobacterium sp. TaxID=165435 RepID=UPI0025970D40|nr:hypothetical protein [uncultured Flavobacterium sp.]